MERSALTTMAMAAVLAISMCMPAKAMAGTCCNDSEPGCNAGQNVGASCGGNNVCVAITDKCTKKKPKFEGVDCSCTTNNSKLEVPELLDFTTLNLSAKPSETKNLKVKNGGGVPFDITYCVTAGSDDFSALSTGTQTGAIAPPVSKEGSPPAPVCTGRMHSAMVPQLGFLNLPLEFAPQLSGDYTGSLYIDSTAALNPSAGLSLLGKGTGMMGFKFLSPTLSISSLGGSAQLACSKAYLGVVFTVPGSSSSSNLMYGFSTNKGKTFSKAVLLYENRDLLSEPLIVPALTGTGFQVTYTDESTSPVSVWTFPFTPGQSSTVTPIKITSGIGSSMAVGGGYYWLGVDALSPSINAQFWGSVDGVKWNQYTVPISTNFTSDANIVYGWGNVWAFWTDSGTTLGSPINRYASLSTNLGMTFGTPMLFHAFPAGATAAYFSPNTSFSGGTVLDPGTWSPDGTDVHFVRRLSAPRRLIAAGSADRR